MEDPEIYYEEKIEKMISIKIILYHPFSVRGKMFKLNLNMLNICVMFVSDVGVITVQYSTEQCSKEQNITVQNITKQYIKVKYKTLLLCTVL